MTTYKFLTHVQCQSYIWSTLHGHHLIQMCGNSKKFVCNTFSIWTPRLEFTIQHCYHWRLIGNPESNSDSLIAGDRFPSTWHRIFCLSHIQVSKTIDMDNSFEKYISCKLHISKRIAASYGLDSPVGETCLSPISGLQRSEAVH